jgi:hypothetical protein
MFSDGFLWCFCGQFVVFSWFVGTVFLASENMPTFLKIFFHSFMEILVSFAVGFGGFSCALYPRFPDEVILVSQPLIEWNSL